MGIDFKTVQVCVNILEPIIQPLQKINTTNKDQKDDQLKDRLHQNFNKTTIALFYISISILCERFNQNNPFADYLLYKKTKNIFADYIEEALDIGEALLGTAKMLLAEEKKVRCELAERDIKDKAAGQRRMAEGPNA